MLYRAAEHIGRLGTTWFLTVWLILRRYVAFPPANGKKKSSTQSQMKLSSLSYLKRHRRQCDLVFSPDGDCDVWYSNDNVVDDGGKLVPKFHVCNLAH